MAATRSYSPSGMVLEKEYILEEYNSDNEDDTRSITDSWSDSEGMDEEAFEIQQFDVDCNEVDNEYEEIQVRVNFENEKQSARIHTIRIPRDACYDGFEYDEENDRVIPKFVEGSWRYQLPNESEQEEKLQEKYIKKDDLNAISLMEYQMHEELKKQYYKNLIDGILNSHNALNKKPYQEENTNKLEYKCEKCTHNEQNENNIDNNLKLTTKFQKAVYITEINTISPMEYQMHEELKKQYYKNLIDGILNPHNASNNKPYQEGNTNKNETISEPNEKEEYVRDPPEIVNQDIIKIEYDCEEYAHNEQIINNINDPEEVKIKIEFPEDENKNSEDMDVILSENIHEPKTKCEMPTIINSEENSNNIANIIKSEASVPVCDPVIRYRKGDIENTDTPTAQLGSRMEERGASRVNVLRRKETDEVALQGNQSVTNHQIRSMDDSRLTIADIRRRREAALSKLLKYKRHQEELQRHDLQVRALEEYVKNLPDYEEIEKTNLGEEEIASQQLMNEVTSFELMEKRKNMLNKELEVHDPETGEKIAAMDITISTVKYKEEDEHRPFQIILKIEDNKLNVSTVFEKGVEEDRASMSSQVSSKGVQVDLQGRSWYGERDPRIYENFKFRPENIDKYGISQNISSEDTAQEEYDSDKENKQSATKVTVTSDRMLTENEKVKMTKDTRESTPNRDKTEIFRGASDSGTRNDRNEIPRVPGVAIENIQSMIEQSADAWDYLARDLIEIRETNTNLMGRLPVGERKAAKEARKRTRDLYNEEESRNKENVSPTPSTSSCTSGRSLLRQRARSPRSGGGDVTDGQTAASDKKKVRKPRR